MLKTGGGVFIPKLSPVDEKILCLLKEIFFSIENQFDSNNEYNTSAILTCSSQNECMRDENTPSTSYAVDHGYCETIGENSIDNSDIENEVDEVDMTRKMDELYEPPKKKLNKKGIKKILKKGSS